MRTFLMPLPMRLALAALCVVSLLGATACGGSSEPPPPPNQFAGIYTWNYAGFQFGPPVRGTGQYGWVESDGVEIVWRGSLASNTQGTLYGPDLLPPFAYSISAGNSLFFNTQGAMLGGLSPSGDVTALITTYGGFEPGLGVLLRRGSGFSLASLTGDYHLCAYFFNGTTDESWWGGTATFDGAGNVMASRGTNENGMITLPGAAVPFGTYTVDADGAVGWTTPGATLVGGIGVAGELVVLTGTATATNAQYLVFLVKAGAGLSDATLSGTYHTSFVGTSLAVPSGYIVATSTSNADGAGMWTDGSGTQNEDGAITAVPALPAEPYLVAADGAITVGAPTWRGGVSPSGDVAVFAGSVVPTEPPQLYFLHR